jgi:hypothetical protein
VSFACHRDPRSVHIRPGSFVYPREVSVGRGLIFFCEQPSASLWPATKSPISLIRSMAAWKVSYTSLSGPTRTTRVPAHHASLGLDVAIEALIADAKREGGLLLAQRQPRSEHGRQLVVDEQVDEVMAAGHGGPQVIMPGARLHGLDGRGRRPLFKIAEYQPPRQGSCACNVFAGPTSLDELSLCGTFMTSSAVRPNNRYSSGCSR